MIGGYCITRRCYINQHAFKDFYIQGVQYHGLPLYNQSTWSSYQAIKSQPQGPRTGMFPPDEPKEIPTDAGNEKMILDNDEASRDILYGPEPYNVLDRYRGEIDLLCNTIGKPTITRRPTASARGAPTSRPK